MVDGRFSRLPVSPFDGQRGPNGRALCQQCGTEISGRRRSYCSDECGKARLALWPSEQRKAVFKRDAGVCANCGLDCERLARDIAARLPGAIQRARQHGFAWALIDGWRSLWEMDHVVPVVEGGGSCGLDNLRTLCVPCHRKETAALAKRRADRRRANKTESTK